MQLMKPSNLVMLLIVAFLLLPITYPEKFSPAVAAPVSLLTRDFIPTADAQVYEDSPNSNYGGIMIYIRSKDGANLRAFIQFDLDNIPPGSKITEATLYLYKYGSPDVARTYRCSRVSGSWSESTITWNNQPAVGSPSSDEVIGTSDGWESWGVTSSVQQFRSKDTASASRNYGWRIADISEGSLVQHQSVFYSKEYETDLAKRPYLRVKYYPPHLELETYGSSFDAGNWVKMTVHRKDYEDNAITRGDLIVKLDSSSTSSNAKFSLTEGGTTITELEIPNGSSSKDFWYYDDKAGTWTIHVYTSDYLYLVGSPPFMIIVMNYGDDSEQQTVDPGPINSFVLGTISSPKIAGVSFTISITAKDEFGNTVTSYTGTNALSDTTGTINPTMTGAFVNGVWSGDVVINKVANNVKVSTSGGGKIGESSAFNVVAGPPAKLLITPPTLTVAAGVQYSSLTIVLKDAHDFEATATTLVTVNLATTSPDGEFREVGTATKITSVSIPAGLDSALVDYYDIRGGTWTLSASAEGLTSGASAVTVIPDTTPPVTTISVGSPKHQAGTTLYVAGSTEIVLTATDDASGVKVTNYRIDGGTWNAYAGAITLASYADGSHTMGYFSSDKAGNNESERTLVVFLDKTAPLIGATEPSGTIIQRTGFVTYRVSVEETGSGVESVELFVDGASEGSMTMEDGDYIKTKEVTPGAHTWSVRIRDNVDNIATTPDIGYTLTIDDQPPTISNVVMAPTSPSWGEPIRVSATIDDALSSILEATIYYSTNGGSSWSNVAMLAPMPPATAYEGTIPTQMPMTRVQFYIYASDDLGNAARSSTQEFVVEIPIWLYGAVGAIVVVSIVAVAVRRRKPSLPPPPPPPP